MRLWAGLWWWRVGLVSLVWEICCLYDRVLSREWRSPLGVRRIAVRAYLHRANWDGEGNWSYETDDQTIARQLVERGKFKMHLLPNAETLLQSYFQYHGEATRHVRGVVDVALVDLGGRPDAVKLPVVNACSHFVIISRDPSQVPLWLELFKSLRSIGVIHSRLETGCRVVRLEPVLEVEAGPWLREKEARVPDVLLVLFYHSKQKKK
jgi:CRISPR-associated protein Csx3